jgi:hypothetical protein
MTAPSSLDDFELTVIPVAGGDDDDDGPWCLKCSGNLQVLVCDGDVPPPMA